MIKRLIIILALLSLFATSAQAQDERTHITTGATLPASCSVGDVWVKTGANDGFYRCSATNTWALIGDISQSVTFTNKTMSGAANTFSNISFSSLSDMAGLSVLGRSANSTGATAAITGTDGQVLRVSGTTLGFGTIATAGLGDNQVTLAKLATQAANTILANLTEGAAVPTAATLTAILDDIMGNTQGAVLFRNATAWVKLDPGTSGQFLKTNGAAANIEWSTPAGAGDVSSNTSSSVADEIALFADTSGKLLKRSTLTGLVLSTSGVASAYGGIDCTDQFVRDVSASGAGTCASVGTNDISANAVTLAKLATQADDTILANISGGTAVPTAASLSAILDATAGSTQGNILFRSTSTWGVLAPGTAGDFLQTQGSGANPQWASTLSASGSATLTNKTIDAEATGNNIIVPSMVTFNAAVCQDTTASLGFSTFAAHPAVAACVTGTNIKFGVAQFVDGADTKHIQGHFTLATDWTGSSDIDLAGKWRTSATSGSVVWQVALACVADGETSDPSFDTADTATDAAKGTTLQQNNFSISSIPATSCSAGDELYFKIFRDPTHASDSLAATAELISFTFTIRRTM